MSALAAVASPPELADSTALMQAALTAVGRGWRVFPLDPGTKKPSIKRWEQRATLDPVRIRRWWQRFPTSNVGIACGPSGLLVLDLDAAHGPVPAHWAALGVNHGRDVIALLAERARQPDPVATFTVATPRDGEHRYFLRPPGAVLRSTVGERGRGLGWRADTRGPGAAVTFVGSVQVIDGRAVPYTVLRDLPVAPLPEWLITALTPPPPPSRPTQVPVLPATGRRVTAYVNAAIAGERHNVATAEEGERHITLYAAAAALGELLANDWITRSAITYHLTDAARHHLGVADFDWKELSNTIHDGIEAGRQRPRVIPDRSRT
ncbi:bifunctional DNA primase/polymerase [Amycolatopsis anabasis]|uniref:bifunctional DNA primase/polymerase n=1 Tax=Amycolatopsis anabasis TaxID=1840409 RepID=UPI00131C7604|nr:bifunctional DNA primase/polymerase [Amycolatopsis anabasis]